MPTVTSWRLNLLSIYLSAFPNVSIAALGFFSSWLRVPIIRVVPKHTRTTRVLEPSRELTEQNLLAHIRRLPHGRATYKQLVKELHLTGENREELEALLDRLVDKGSLVELRSGHFIATGPDSEYVTGRLSIHRDGFGFLIPEASPGGLAAEDIFLPPQEAAKGMHGDRAVVRVVRRSGEGRAEGELQRILRRAHMTVVGEFRVRKRGNYVVPFDDRIQQWLVVPEGLEFPTQAQSADRVGAEIREYRTLEDLDGAVVNVEVLEFPEGREDGVGRVLEVLGYPDDFGVDVEIIIRKHHLPHQFPPEVLEQARSVESTASAKDTENRRDFRHLPILTIDGETARDFDDAVYVERHDDGSYSLQVHIADVSHYVRPNSPIDIEAQLRGTSVYFPDRAVPMLPVELSTDICSLRPNEDRLVLSALLRIDPTGDVVAQEFTRGVIRSVERMTYTDVFRVLEGDAPMRQHYAALADQFELMRELALLLNKRRVRRGSIDFDLPESNILINLEGHMTGVTRAERNIAHRIIEEFMLAANEAVASHLENAAIPSLFRIHERPDAKRVLDFEEIAAHYGYSLGVGPIPVKRFAAAPRQRDGRARRDGGSRGRRETYLPSDDFELSSRHYQRLIAKIAGKPEERILSYLMLRSLKQARYSERNEGHFALAATSYTHFTSPIRRYPDLVVHRILSHWLDTKQLLLERSALHEVGNDTSFTERRAAEAERELVEWKKVKFMEDRVGDEFSALIISTARFGFFVELSDLFVEGLVPIETLPGDRYVYHENGRKIIGERNRRSFGIGDQVRVRLDRADTVERKLQFGLAEPSGGGRKRRKN